jgi:hypothetical protein
LLQRSLIQNPGLQAPNSTEILGPLTQIAAPPRRYRATLLSTLGEWIQDILVTPRDTQWLVATRLRKGHDGTWLEKHIDRDFPRQPDGTINWN